MNGIIDSLTRLHDRVFGALEIETQDWFLGLAARFVPLRNSGWSISEFGATKLGDVFSVHNRVHGA